MIAFILHDMMSELARAIGAIVDILAIVTFGYLIALGAVAIWTAIGG